MALALQRQSGNISRSIQVAIADDTITVGGDTYQVYPDYRWGDPDAAGSPGTTPDNAFVTLTWLQESAGRKGPSVLQVDIYSRIKAQNDADADPFRLRAGLIADEIETTFTGTNAAGSLNACVRILDFNSDPVAPVATDDVAVCRNANNVLGEADSRRNLGDEGGLWRISITFRFWLSQDLTGASGLYYGLT